MKCLALITVVTFVGIAFGDDTCQTVSPCVFQESNGKFIDLTPIKDVLQTNDNAGTSIFTFSPCTAFACSGDDDALACEKGFGSNGNVLVPKGSTVTCMKDGDNLALQYKKANTTFTVELNCMNAPTSLKYESGSQNNEDFKFVLSSRFACDNSSIPAPDTTTTNAPSSSTSKSTQSPSTSKSQSTSKSTSGSTKTPTPSAAGSSTSKPSTTPGASGSTKTSGKTPSGTTKTSPKTTKPSGKTPSGTTKTSPVTTKPSSKIGTTHTGTTPKVTKVSTSKTTHHGNAAAITPMPIVLLATFILFVSRMVKL